MRRSLWVLVVLAGFLAPTQAESTIWDLLPGKPASEQPRGFVEQACGTNGGPPAEFIDGFEAFSQCAAEPSGLHEVYFRYDDEAAIRHDALGLPTDATAGATRVYGMGAILSALFDDAGLLRGLRIVSDPRGAEAHVRNDHWRLAGLLQRHFGAEDWACSDIAPSAREEAVSSYFVRRNCSKETLEYGLTSSQDYFHKSGEQFVDEFGKVQATYFVSTSRFEILWKDGARSE